MLDSYHCLQIIPILKETKYKLPYLLRKISCLKKKASSIVSQVLSNKTKTKRVLYSYANEGHSIQVKEQEKNRFQYRLYFYMK